MIALTATATPKVQHDIQKNLGMVEAQVFKSSFNRPNLYYCLLYTSLVKKYGKRTVVSHVSINVKQGEIVGLLGPNGAGKTTSFYMTVGLITPNEGRIFLDDLDITKYPVYKRAQTGIGLSLIHI